jgi:alpha-mannosidase
MNQRSVLLLSALATAGLAVDAAAQSDSTPRPTLYVVAYAHLDTEWRWEFPQTIQEYLSKTLRNNFALFERHPHYVFNFTGANRYMLMKEYYPVEYARLKQYVEAGRWFPAGSSVEENDVNTPSAESVIRQVLYGNAFFRQEFGKASEEYMLPDCFGFPASLPSILAHAGIKGFSTQKLSKWWQPAPHVGGPGSPEQTPEGIPFNVGLWAGPDGKSVIAALNPSSYDGDVHTDLSQNNVRPDTSRDEDYVWNWPERVDLNGKVTGIYADYHYVGTGDIGGSPDEASVGWMERIQTGGQGPLKVIWSNADQLFRDIQSRDLTRLPRYAGDLELINHSAGSITSQAYHKRWNRRNEILADGAEKASVAAAALSGLAYPRERLNQAWRLLLTGQFHDNLAGTSTPKAYEYVWNDDVIALNQFAQVLTSATSGVAAALDTRTQGVPVVVYNQLNLARQDLAEASIAFPGGVPRSVRVVGPDGKDVPAQVADGGGGTAKVLFLATAPSVGFAVYDVRPVESAPTPSPLRVTSGSLENGRYRVTLNADGDVAGIFDKTLGRELLSAPIRLAISTDNPRQWPAWNMDFGDEQRPPRAFVGGPAEIRVVENGPARVAVEVARQAEGSKFVETIRLAAGDAGNRVEFAGAIDWMTSEANLKVVFPLTATNPDATYNWDIGTIQRPNAAERQFEVASHQWVDLTDRSGRFGATVLTGDKVASDKPGDEIVRLTLLRTPGVRGGYRDQATQDWGHHDVTFGLAGHRGDWRSSQTDWQAYRLNQPLQAFLAGKHAGVLGKTFSLLTVSDSRVRVLALKQAEQGEETIVRLVEMSGKAAPDVRIAFPWGITAAREVNGQEQPVGPATVRSGALVTSFGPYQPRTFALRLGAAPQRAAAPSFQTLRLPYDASVATATGRPGEGCFDCDLNDPDAAQGGALPAEMLPADVAYGAIQFHLAPAGSGQANAVTARGQTIELPRGDVNRLYLLAASYGGDQSGVFRVGGDSVALTIQDWGGFIGQWDNRSWSDQMEYTGLKPGFIKRAPVAWFASHHHGPDGADQPYAYAYLFAYVIDLPPGARSVALPDNPKIRILAATAAQEPDHVVPAHPLYDTLGGGRRPVAAMKP